MEEVVSLERKEEGDSSNTSTSVEDTIIRDGKCFASSLSQLINKESKASGFRSEHECWEEEQKRIKETVTNW